jgi:hypothetical protein
MTDTKQWRVEGNGHDGYSIVEGSTRLFNMCHSGHGVAAGDRKVAEETVEAVNQHASLKARCVELAVKSAAFDALQAAIEKHERAYGQMIGNDNLMLMIHSILKNARDA